MHERRIALRGTYNFRDFGGYQTSDGLWVRRQTLYRSDNLSRLSRQSYEPFQALGIRLLVDLRTEYETKSRPNALPPNHSIRLEHLPISMVPELEKKWTAWEQLGFMLSGRFSKFDKAYIRGVYQQLGDRAAEAISSLFQLLLDPSNYPVLIMCMGGRDRTGFSAAMVLSALGVPLESVIEDYDLTNLYAAKTVDRMIKTIRVLSLYRVTESQMRELLRAHPDYLRAAVETIVSTYGSVETYFRERVGLSDTDRQKLREMLLERR